MSTSLGWNGVPDENARPKAFMGQGGGSFVGGELVRNKDDMINQMSEMKWRIIVVNAFIT